MMIYVFQYIDLQLFKNHIIHGVQTWI